MKRDGNLKILRYRWWLREIGLIETHSLIRDRQTVLYGERMMDYQIPRLNLFNVGMYETLFFIDRISFHRLIYSYRNDYKPFK